MKPIKMTPAYRHGIDTPWGGTALKDVYHLDIPDEHTGEALAVSAIPGLNSRDENGTELSGLIAQYGEKLVGTQVHPPFPLLLKLLDAREILSVQVHPGDEYAARVEHKLGKTEAWVILKANQGAKLVYGIQPGTTMNQLRDASLQGREVEKYLRYVPVREGETYYIPSGTVHAIGAGIVLYEIQQSSDVTYRFYDWDRYDPNGVKRPVHLRQALDVADLDLCPEAVIPRVMEQTASGTRLSLLDEKYFGLDRLEQCSEYEMRPEITRFSILTAIEDGHIRLEDAEITMNAGETVLVPAQCDLMWLTGTFLHAFPTIPRTSPSH